MKIDWNSAPDATHYDKRKGCIPAFMRQAADGIGWEFRKTNGSWMYYGELTDEQAAKLNKRPAPWTGEGLPPVGMVCEFQFLEESHQFKAELVHGHRVTVIAHYAGVTGRMVAAFTFDYEDGNARDVESATEAHFRPIRTPEQIAAEERELEIIEIERVAMSGGTVKTMAEALYDGGYRKQVKP